MNKIINKALFYKEWINVKYVTILSTLVLLYFKVFGVITKLNTNKRLMKECGEIWTERWFNNGLFDGEAYYALMIFVVIALCIILFLGEKKSETQGFIMSMPFTRKEIIINKWIVGIVSLLISFGVTYIVLSLLYVANLSAIDTNLNPYSDIVKWFFMDTFSYICIFTFMIFIQSVMGNSIVSSIVGSIILLVPCFILTIVQEIVFRITKCNWNSNIMMVFNKLKHWLYIYCYNSPKNQWYDVKSSTNNTMRQVFYYNNYELKLVILIILTCLFLYLACTFYKKRNMEYNLRLLCFKNFELVFICGFSICAGFLLGAIFGFATFNSDGLGLFWIFTAIGLIAGYFVSRILIRLFSTSK